MRPDYNQLAVVAHSVGSNPEIPGQDSAAEEPIERTERIESSAEEEMLCIQYDLHKVLSVWR
jgi:hypothetical protein